MKKLEIMTKLGQTFNKVGFELKKHSPELLIVGGIIGVVASTVMACKATTKVGGVIEEAKETVDIIHEGMEKGEIQGQEFTPDDGKKALAVTYAKTGLELVKLYAPAVGIGALSLSCIITSNNILRSRAAALAAAYATVDKSFKEYRTRVIDRFGEEVDRELKYNVKAKTIQETVVDENGEEKTVTSTVYEASDYLHCSEFAKIFDECNPYWHKDADSNLFFLKSIQSYLNNVLVAKRYLFLNEAYEALGFEPTKAGQVVGWTYDPNNPKKDNFVDLGLTDINRPSVKEFLNGYERCVILDFNVEGNILDNVPIEYV